MKKYQITGILCLALGMPLQAYAVDDEVTIRVMQRNEHTQQAVLHVVELPPVASDSASENGQQANRQQEQHRLREHKGDESSQEQQGNDAQEEMMNQSQIDRNEASQIMEQARQNSEATMNESARMHGPDFE